MDDFRPRAIVIPEGAARPALTAARELQAALARAGAPELPVVGPGGAPAPRGSGPALPAGAPIPADGGPCGGDGPAFVVGAPPAGERDASRLAPEACRIARRGDRLHLWGEGSRGPLHAVYAYLQDVLGFRWLTGSVEVRPRLDPAAPLRAPELEQRPGFAIRDVGYYEAMQAPWSARLRLNGEFCSRALGPEWGGGMRYTHYVHTFYDLVPPQRHFAAHPEYFALVDGRRRDALAQLCLTHPDIVPIAADAVRAWFAADPSARIASVSQNDWLGACECPDCRALVEREGSQVGPVLHFVNAVARAVAGDHPDRLIDTLAYWYTEDPPRHVRPEPNVVVRLCHMSPSCEAHAIEACPHNAPFAARLEAWSRIAPRLHIWDYQTNFAHLLMPFPNFAAIASDLRLFRRRGVESMFCQGDLEDGGGGEWSTLRAYYLARLLWDPALDPEALVDEFLRGVFPRAHGPVRAYFDGIQARAADPGRHLRMFSPVQAGHLPPEVVGAAARQLAEAGAAAAGDGAERAEVRHLQLGIDYVRLATPPEFVLDDDVLRPTVPAAAAGDADGFLAPDRRPEAMVSFFGEMERLGVRRLQEAIPPAVFRRRAEGLAASHPAPLWTAGPWRLRVVPDLGGRLWEASFRGVSLLAPAAWDDGAYPASRGYDEGVAGDLGRSEPHTVEAWEGARVALTAVLDGMSAWHPYAGIAVRREMTVGDDGALRIRTTVTNTDGTAHPLAVRPRWCLGLAAEAVAWLGADGRWSRPEAESGVLPNARGWRTAGGGLALECIHGAVDRLQVERRPWGWLVAAAGVQEVVPPGGAVALEQVWRAEG